MSLRQIFKDAMPGVFQAGGAPAVFTHNGTPKNCFVFVSYNIVVQPMGAEAGVWQTVTSIEASLEGVGNVLPERGDTFYVPEEDNKTFTVQGILENDLISVKLVVT